MCLSWGRYVLYRKQNRITLQAVRLLCPRSKFLMNAKTSFLSVTYLPEDFVFPPSHISALSSLFSSCHWLLNSSICTPITSRITCRLKILNNRKAACHGSCLWHTIYLKNKQKTTTTFQHKFNSISQQSGVSGWRFHIQNLLASEMLQLFVICFN